MFPASDQLTRQTASGKWGSLDGADGKRGVEVHGEVGDGREWIITVRSYSSALSRLEVIFKGSLPEKQRQCTFLVTRY
jgi:hypothetical protein